ncbi:MAG TPA: PQQ-binding-like beta-propeller repeat protein [Gaiellaceae bacterium]|nr:PQQ-binding-like beta-propeller repeat protein [Gaiellaceae bacterium]
MYPFATGITAANVKSLKLRKVALDGTVDSSPIYLKGVLFVTTTYGRTEAVNASTGAVKWRFTPPGYSSWVGSPQITTATPVADPSGAYLYAASPGGRIYKLATSNGHAAWSVSITKLPSREKIAGALNYANGHVIAVTGGYIGDTPPYQGHVVLIAPKTGKLLHVWNSLCSDRTGLMDPTTCEASDSAIWGRSGAVVDPSTGDLLVTTGNAPWNGRTNWGDAVIRLSPDATRILGNYTPTNTAEMNADDVDLGSTSPVILDDGHLAQGGKDGMIRVISVAAMSGTAPHKGGELQLVATPSHMDLFTAPVVWHSGATTWFFAADNGATAAWTYSKGHLTQVWKHDTGGTSPVVAGGLLWVYDPGGGLNVYQPASGALVATLPCGGGHWNSPIVIDGHVALPEGNANDHATSGVLDIWSVR